MRVLVRVAGGFIGSNVCDALLAQGHDVDGLAREFDWLRRQQTASATSTSEAHVP